MANRATSDERLGYLIHLNGRLHSSVNALLLQRILQRQSVNHGSQHTHVIGGDTVHFPRLPSHTAEEISAPDHNRDLNAK